MFDRSSAVSIRERPMRAPSRLWTEAQTMVSRSLRLSLRNVDSLMTAFVLPVLLMLMFVSLFGGAIHTGSRYVDYVVPGVLLVCVGFGAATTAVSVSHDLTTGIIDRFRSLDVRGETLINGHVAASVLRNLLSSAVVFAVALAIGFKARPHGAPSNWMAAIGILARTFSRCRGLRRRSESSCAPRRRRRGSRSSSASCPTRAARLCPCTRCRHGCRDSPQTSPPPRSPTRSGRCSTETQRRAASGTRSSGASD